MKMHLIRYLLCFPLLTICQAWSQTDTIFISFEYNSSKVPDTAFKINWDQYAELHIHAYSSGPGSTNYNLQLSKERAENFLKSLDESFLRNHSRYQYFGDENNAEEADNKMHRGLKIFALKKPQYENVPVPPNEVHLEPKIHTKVLVKDIVTQEIITAYKQEAKTFSADGYKDTLVSVPNVKEFTVFLTPNYIHKFIRMENLQFYGDSDILLPESERQLEMYIVELLTYEGKCFKVHGHVNAPFNMQVNMSKNDLQDLSNRRALAVQRKMVKAGIGKKQISCEGFSNQRMINPYAKSEQEMRLNRRVEIIVVECSKTDR